MPLVDVIFNGLNCFVLPFWLLLLFVPKWSWTQRLAGLIGPALLSLFFVVMFFREFSTSGGSFGSFTALRYLFANPSVLLAGWAHYLAFDLFVGAWEVRDAQKLGIPHLKVVPCLLLTLLLGPIGLFGYLMIRTSLTKNIES